MITHNIKLLALGLSISFIIFCIISLIYINRRLSKKSIFFRYGGISVMTIGCIIIFLSVIGVIKSVFLTIFAGYLMGIGAIFAGYAIKYREALVKKGVEIGIGNSNKSDKFSYRVLLVSGWVFLFILTLINILIFF